MSGKGSRVKGKAKPFWDVFKIGFAGSGALNRDQNQACCLGDKAEDVMVFAHSFFFVQGTGFHSQPALGVPPSATIGGVNSTDQDVCLLVEGLLLGWIEGKTKGKHPKLGSNRRARIPASWRQCSRPEVQEGDRGKPAVAARPPNLVRYQGVCCCYY